MLPDEYAKICIKAGELHLEFADEIFALVKNASVSGEPVIRYMEYEFPGQGMAAVNDQFMLGSRVLVAPVTVKGMTKRDVVLPAGKWKYCDGTVYDGGCTVKVDAPVNVLPYFERV